MFFFFWPVPSKNKAVTHFWVPAHQLRITDLGWFICAHWKTIEVLHPGHRSLRLVIFHYSDCLTQFSFPTYLQFKALCLACLNKTVALVQFVSVQVVKLGPKTSTHFLHLLLASSLRNCRETIQANLWERQENPWNVRRPITVLTANGLSHDWLVTVSCMSGVVMITIVWSFGVADQSPTKSVISNILLYWYCTRWSVILSYKSIKEPKKSVIFTFLFI